MQVFRQNEISRIRNNAMPPAAFADGKFPFVRVFFLTMPWHE